jgi:phosphomannomutase
MISRNIFRQYDIRGLVSRELDDDTVRRIAQAFATMAAEKGLNKVVLGRWWWRLLPIPAVR